MAFAVTPQPHPSFSSDSENNTALAESWAQAQRLLFQNYPISSPHFQASEPTQDPNGSFTSLTSLSSHPVTRGLTSYCNRASQLLRPKESLRPFLSVLLLCWLQTVVLFWRTLTSTRFFHVALLKISSFSYIKFYCWIHPILGYFLPIFINNSIAITIAHLAAVLCKGLPGWYIL